MFYFLLGTILASFTQLIAHRFGRNLPKQYRSYCPNCQKTLRFYQILPIVSFVYLKGRCPYCHSRIPSFYILMEILGGVLTYSTTYMTSYISPVWLVFLYALFIFAQIDLEQGIVPNSWLLFLLIILLYISPPNVTNCLYALFFIITWCVWDYFFPHYIGGADIKLIGLWLLFFDVTTVATFVCFSCLTALWVIVFRTSKQPSIPFVPFLFTGMFLTILIHFFHIIA